MMLTLLAAAALAADPLACQPNAEQPMLPIFHIIGNVTKNADNSITLEPINDCSGVTFYEGLWHLWHQCCQSHWDHLISKDLVHWQRLPPPIQPMTTRTWDGSISMLSAEDGGPLILYDAEDGKLGAPLDRPILGVARLADPKDKYLLNWTRVANNPVVFDGAAAAFPGQVFKNGDHWNMVMQGNRYQSNDSTFHNWKNMGAFVPGREHGGQWWLPMPKQRNGSPAPRPQSLAYIVNIGGGDLYLWGDYYTQNETFEPLYVGGSQSVKTSELEHGQGGWFGMQMANERALMIGWGLEDYHGDAGPGINFLTRLTLLREVNFDVATMDLVSNPVPELTSLRTGTLASEKNVALDPKSPHYVQGTSGGPAASADLELTFHLPAAGSASFGACVLAQPEGSPPFVPHWEIVPDSNAGYAKVGVPGNKSTELGNATDATACQTLCQKKAGCLEWAWKIWGPKAPAPFANETLDCYMINDPTDLDTPAIRSQPGATSGKFIQSDPSGLGLGITLNVAAGDPPVVTASVGVCPNGSSTQGATGTPVKMLSGETSVTVRILPDRSIADFFVQGGRWAGSVAWVAGTPRAPKASQVSLFGSAGVTADVEVYGMGCGWANPSYTPHPTM